MRASVSSRILLAIFTPSTQVDCSFKSMRTMSGKDVHAVETASFLLLHRSAYIEIWFVL